MKTQALTLEERKAAGLQTWHNLVPFCWPGRGLVCPPKKEKA